MGASLFLPLRDHNPRSRFPRAVLALVLINTAIYLFLAALDLQSELDHQAGAIPLEITTLTDVPPLDIVPPPFTILSSMFLHGGFWHLLGNMWFLWIFGDNVEDRMGSLKFLAFYLVTGVVGAISQCLLMPSSPIPMVGASGAVAGVLGAYFLLFPRARIVSLLFFFRVSVPAWVFLGGWFAAQLFLSHSGIAWMAHVGGFLAGLGLIRLFAAPRPIPVVEVVEMEYLPPPPRRRDY
jgi:membrane associated rhomboid family serine protease